MDIRGRILAKDSLKCGETVRKDIMRICCSMDIDAWALECMGMALCFMLLRFFPTIVNLRLNGAIVHISHCKYYEYI